MKFVRFICHLGVALSLAGGADAVRRYFVFEHIIPGMEEVKESEGAIKRYEDLVKDHPHGKALASIYRSQAGTQEVLVNANIEQMRAFQTAMRDQAILFGMLFLLFGVLTLRMSGSNKALQGDGPRPAGSARA